MTEDGFRKLALGLPDVIEGAHMGHADFRLAGGRIIATLGYPKKGFGMVALAPDEQSRLLRERPGIATLAKGAWGKGGASVVLLKSARKEWIQKALEAAWVHARTKRKR